MRDCSVRLNAQRVQCRRAHAVIGPQLVCNRCTEILPCLFEFTNHQTATMDDAELLLQRDRDAFSDEVLCLGVELASGARKALAHLEVHCASKHAAQDRRVMRIDTINAGGVRAR